MRSLIAIVALVLLVASGGCGSDHEVASLARQQWKITRIGGADYICETRGIMELSAPGNTPPPRKESTAVFELRSHKIEIHSEPLAEAAKLNGVEWEGSATLKADAFRRYSRADGDNAWSGWISPQTANMGTGQFDPQSYRYTYTNVMSIRKVNGKWEVKACPNQNLQMFGDAAITFREVTPSDLPK